MKKCIYCDTGKKSEHFICEKCSDGMCGDCYEHQTEHDSHYHEICNSCYDEKYKVILKVIGHEPAYICKNIN